jgi:VWFA-related protein
MIRALGTPLISGLLSERMGAMQEYRNRWALRSLRWLVFFVAVFSASTISPQQAPPPQSTTSATAPSASLRATTHLVLVDVVVYDKQGNHVSNLTSADFTLRDRGKPQTIAVFSDERAGASFVEKAPPPPQLAPDVFTNRPDYHHLEGPATILLLDGLNTAVADQQLSHDSMLQYLRTQLKEGQRTAILALNDSLLLLQDFTTDPRFLIAALDKDKPKTSEELSGPGVEVLSKIEAQAMDPRLLHTLDQLNQRHAAESADERVRITLAALRSIARAVGGIPGRKNLIWVSSAFPFSLQPGSSDYFDAERTYGDETRRTAELLASARVAVYTVDARGLSVSLTTNGRNPTGLVETVQQPDNLHSVEEQLANSPDAIIGSHGTMQDLAKETGGLAFYNHNDITRAVALSAADGRSYYTLGYYPEGGHWDGKFHRIEVKIVGHGLEARYRSGYFAVDVAQTFASENPQQRERQAFDELRAAIADPLPATQVTFRAHIPTIQPAAKAQIQIQFLVDTTTISFDGVETGRPHCSLDFMVAATSPEGKIVTADGRAVDAQLKPDQYAQATQHGLPFSMPLALAPGTYSLRLAVRDSPTGQIGTLTVPLSVPAP